MLRQNPQVLSVEEVPVILLVAPDADPLEPGSPDEGVCLAGWTAYQYPGLPPVDDSNNAAVCSRVRTGVRSQLCMPGTSGSLSGLGRMIAEEVQPRDVPREIAVVVCREAVFKQP